MENGFCVYTFIFTEITWKIKILRGDFTTYYEMIRYTFYTSLELSTWRAVRFHLPVLPGFCVLSCGFSCSVLKMEVERCNWALCRTPNCLIMNINV